MNWQIAASTAFAPIRPDTDRVNNAARHLPTAAERQARGERLRARVPRDSHAEWEPHADRDPVGILAVQRTHRVRSLVPIRYGRM